MTSESSKLIKQSVNINTSVDVNKKNIRQYDWCIKTLLVGACVAAVSWSFDPYFAYLATSWLAFGLIGLSLDLVWGRGGVLSLGQTAFYGVGGYVGGIVAINFADVTGNSLIWCLPAGAIAGALVSGLVGAVIFYGRLGPLQTTILTYTFTLILWTIAINFSVDIGDAYVGGDNGMSDIPSMVLGFGPDAEPLSEHAMFLFALALTVVIYLIVQIVMRSPFGLISDCIRMNSAKTELIGYDIRKMQLLLFVFAGAIAGIAGALFASWSNYLSPSIFSVSEALLIPIYVLVGGKGRLFSAFLGVVVVGGMSYWLGSGVAGGQTTLILGVFLIVLVLFFKEGVVGIITDIWLRIRKSSTSTIQEATQEGESKVHVREELLGFLKSTTVQNKNVNFKTDKITKRFGGVTPCNQVTQKFSIGNVSCLIGPNGAGKSTFLKCCTGTHDLSEGNIIFNGKNISKWEPFQRVQEGIGIKMQVAQVFGELTIRENLWIAAYSREKDHKKVDQTVRDVLILLGMDGYSERLSSELSHGEQQWLDIGMVLCLKPMAILLDEPAAGMTQEETRELSTLCRLLASRHIVIVIEHDMEFIRSLNGDCTVLHQGEVFAEGSIEELRENDDVLDIYLGRKKDA
ncbi:MAG: ABC transporter permease subunit [Cellvibrionaceae bacterium]